MCRENSATASGLRERACRLGVDIVPYGAPPEDVLEFPFAQKGFAAAEAERRAAGKAGELMWFDRDSLVLGDLSPLLLRANKKLSFRPVNVRNIGMTIDGSLPQEEFSKEFWLRSYVLGGVDFERMDRTTSYIDQKKLYFYIAAGLVGVRPEFGILQKWAELLRVFASDLSIQACCRERMPYRIFMHQAALSVAVAAMTRFGERQELPPSAMYPMNFWKTDSNACRPVRLDDIISLRYDTALDDDGWRKYPMSAELREWLDEHIHSVRDRF